MNLAHQGELFDRDAIIEIPDSVAEQVWWYNDWLIRLIMRSPLSLEPSLKAMKKMGKKWRNPSYGHVEWVNIEATISRHEAQIIRGMVRLWDFEPPTSEKCIIVWGELVSPDILNIVKYIHERAKELGLIKE